MLPQLKIFLAIFLLTASVDFSIACDGFKLKIKQLKSCDGVNSIIKIDSGNSANFTVKLTKDCLVKVYGCLDITGFSSAMAKFTIAKNGMVLLQSKEDLCALMGNASKKYKSILATFGIPEKCPVPQSKICSDESKQIDVSHLKRFFSLAQGGTIKIDAEVKHDKGKSCALAVFEMRK